MMQFLEQLEYVEETQDGVQGSSWIEMALFFRNTARGLPAEKVATQPHLGGAAHSEGSTHHAACGGLQRGYLRSSEGSFPSAGEAAVQAGQEGEAEAQGLRGDHVHQRRQARGRHEPAGKG